MQVGKGINVGFGGSCHWCTEAVFLSLKGVMSVRQGWIAGEDMVFSEAVVVEYDPEAISLHTLIAVHLHTHSSTSSHDMRVKYRSAVYVYTPDQAASAGQALQECQSSFDSPLITTIVPFFAFRENEEHYRNYYYSDPDKPFCRTYIDPKLRQLIALFSKDTDLDKITSSVLAGNEVFHP